MRIVIDLQGAQGTNRDRGIGRYSMLFARALARNAGKHEIFLALNGSYPESTDAIRAAFSDLLPTENIKVWSAIVPSAAREPGNQWRALASRKVRDAFLAHLRPDIVHVSSLFEGYVDSVITGVPSADVGMLTSVTLYDLIPRVYPEHYLTDPTMRQWYGERIEELRRAHLCLAISEYSRREGIDLLGLPEDKAVNVSSDVDPMFGQITVTPEMRSELMSRYGLRRDFVMYTGGIEWRKNVDGLIRAFAMLPEALRERHQLAVVCAIDAAAKHRLSSLARESGLGDGEVVFTGFVPEQDLVTLYNCCKLFVFPSWHEGFGLPVLEAMRCGAPVIAARAAGLVELVKEEEGLFASRSDPAMAQAMARVLDSDELRRCLVRGGVERASAFSWDGTAQRSLGAMEMLHAEQRACQRPTRAVGRQRLAYVSPVPPLHTGIADYSAELLPHLARYYDVEVISDQDEVSDAWIANNCPIRAVESFRRNASSFDRVLYHFGNSEFHQHMFELAEQAPGVVVMHDFFLSGIVAHRDLLGSHAGSWLGELYRSHGYGAAVERTTAKDCADVIWKYPCSLGVIESGIGAIAHSNFSLTLARHWYDSMPDRWAVIPHLRVAEGASDRGAAKHRLGLEKDGILVCAFGLLGPTKLNHRLVEAWAQSSLARDARCRLVFVGQNENGGYGARVREAIGASAGRERIAITGWVDRETFRTYLAAADIAVQLRTLSRGETSGAVLDCMNHGVATIVNANGSQGELDRDGVHVLPDEFVNSELVAALEELLNDAERRAALGSSARKLIQERHDPEHCAKLYFDAIERFYREARYDERGLARAVGSLGLANIPDTELHALARSVSRSFSAGRHQLLVDVSELVCRDRKSGIQRVVRKVLGEWLRNPPEGFRVEPVYATPDQGYRYARRFTMDFLGASPSLRDEPIDYAHGDVFVGLDLQPQVVTAHRHSYQEMRRYGVRVAFVTYDLLCITHPECFFPGAAEGISRWLEIVAENDAAICISRSVADELRSWVEIHAPKRQADLAIEWFHLGADFLTGGTSEGRRDSDASDPIGTGCKTFLMVGTIEPRKCHVQVLDAFEKLWLDPDLPELRLLIVGKEGWMTESLIERLQMHPELGKRLQWRRECSDSSLLDAYRSASCLIAASVGEGFGLPIAEAAQHGLPIIARDLPVFRELAGERAFYFDAGNGQALATAIREWIELDARQVVPSSTGIPVLTWSESAAWLAKLCCHGRDAAQPGTDGRTGLGNAR